MKKLILLSILLIVGCTRKYECDVGTIDDDGEFQSLHGGEESGASTTPDWWDFSFDHEDAEEMCEETYNDGKTAEFHCICERAN